MKRLLSLGKRWTRRSDYPVSSRLFAHERFTFLCPMRFRRRRRRYINYATSLPPHQASAKRLARLIREHWWVENKLHHVKDRTFLEDRHWVKNPATAQSFTFLRTLAADMLRRVQIPGGTGREHCPARIEYMQGSVSRPLRLVMGEK